MPPTLRSRRVTRVLVALGAAAALALAFGAGRVSSPRTAAPARGPATAPVPAYVWPAGASAPPPAGQAAPAMPAAVAEPPPAAATPAVRAAVVAEARARLESLRGYMTSRCWPEGGLPGGRERTTVKLNLTFDREGREIARGLSEERRARAGVFTACLRRLAGTRLEVAPPGVTVGVAVVMQFP